MRPTITLALQNVHMGLGHTGLKTLCQKFGRKMEHLEPQELVVLINRARDRIKIFGGSGQVLSYIKLNDGRKVDISAIAYLPQTFGASGFDYDEALQKSLTRTLARPSRPGQGPSAAWKPTRGNLLEARSQE